METGGLRDELIFLARWPPPLHGFSATCPLTQACDPNSYFSPWAISLGCSLFLLTKAKTQ